MSGIDPHHHLPGTSPNSITPSQPLREPLPPVTSNPSGSIETKTAKIASSTLRNHFTSTLRSLSSRIVKTLSLVSSRITRAINAISPFNKTSLNRSADNSATPKAYIDKDGEKFYDVEDSDGEVEEGKEELKEEYFDALHPEEYFDPDDDEFFDAETGQLDQPVSQASPAGLQAEPTENPVEKMFTTFENAWEGAEAKGHAPILFSLFSLMITGNAKAENPGIESWTKVGEKKYELTFNSPFEGTCNEPFSINFGRISLDIGAATVKFAKKLVVEFSEENGSQVLNLNGITLKTPKSPTIALTKIEAKQDPTREGDLEFLLTGSMSIFSKKLSTTLRSFSQAESFEFWQKLWH